MDEGIGIMRALRSSKAMIRRLALCSVLCVAVPVLSCHHAFLQVDEAGDALMAAAEKGDATRVRDLLNRGANPNVVVRGWSPLHAAAGEGHVEAVRILLAKGADVNTTSGNGVTPLHSAAYLGHEEVARILVQAGARLDARDRLGMRPAQAAQVSGHQRLSQFLSSKEAKPQTNHTPVGNSGRLQQGAHSQQPDPNRLTVESHLRKDGGGHSFSAREFILYDFRTFHKDLEFTRDKKYPVVLRPDHDDLAVVEVGDITLLGTGQVLAKRRLSCRDRQFPKHDGIGLGSVVFSPDSKRLCYAALIGDFWHVVLDDKLGPGYEGIVDMAPVFSPDSSRLAYGVKTGGDCAIVVDREMEKSFDGILAGTFKFSPDSDRHVYAAKRGADTVVVLNGRIIDQGAEVSDILFSPDGSSLAYAVRRGTGWAVVTRGKREKEFICDDFLRGSLRFGVDASSLSYVAVKAKKTIVVVNGEESECNERIVKVIFSEDSKRQALVAIRDSRVCLVVDGREVEGYEDFTFSAFVFSPGGKRWACPAKRGRKWYMLTSDGAMGPYDALLAVTPAFSPDSDHLAYLSTYNETPCILVDGQPVKGVAFAGVVNETKIKWHSADGFSCVVASPTKPERNARTLLSPMGVDVPPGAKLTETWEISRIEVTAK